MSLSSSENDSTVLMQQRRLSGVIALKGLPSTCKTELAFRIGRWAECPVLCIQDFLGEGEGLTYKFGGAEADFSPPTATDQVERHHRKAFASLLAVAFRLLYDGGCQCVVIKSNINTPYELQQLLQLPVEMNQFMGYVHLRLIIIECKIRNKFQWRERFQAISYQFEESRSWSWPRRWEDIEQAPDDDCAAHQYPPHLDLNHLLQRIDALHLYVAWLGVDPFNDLSLSWYCAAAYRPLPMEFKDAIKYLLSVPKQELPQNPYVVEYDEFRQFLFDQKLKAAARKGRSESFCEGDCVFRYCQVPEAGYCGVCQGEISREPAYTCHFCVTSLHKTCAEMFPTSALQSTINNYVYRDKVEPDRNPFEDHYHPCKACKGGGKEFSKECRSCIFQHRLKFHLVPAILNHTSHPHFLSIQIFNKDYCCKACGFGSFYILPGYGCKKCAFYCHSTCSFYPLELKQVHGGHEHVMKLMYTRDAMEEEEEDPIWCDCCYQDMDPELWFYACQHCPHHVVHLPCSGGTDLRLNDPKMVIKVVEQLQSQLDDWHAAGNSIQPR